MKKIITKDYATMSELAAAIVLEKMMLPKRVNLSLTAGNTPVGMYEILIDKLQKMDFDRSTVHYYNFDEIPLVGERYGVTMSALNTAFYDQVHIDHGNLHELTAENNQAYDQKILQDGGLDLVVMGVGSDGHFCANMPGYTSFDRETFAVSFEKGDGLYTAITHLTDKEPASPYVTFGPRTILASKQLLVFANGKSKAEIMKKVLEGPITEEVPASILRTHPNITFILDEEAAALLEN
ncbi:glucosamine-6-phosphate deaminase [Lactococcus kimchii]|uniref:glucosamine-6-phosphate deaminase n=1 Tax=Lactococcus sp. S-13 TaxID=2507158 RepID=UPI001023AB31|nr:glucosamine-6-phosphate deaminase [Lactococcus sp. S-13]RZI49086.1 glucosamine-6-phosphate deaminase [Lactococcus sp. S-13]